MGRVEDARKSLESEAPTVGQQRLAQAGSVAGFAARQWGDTAGSVAAAAVETATSTGDSERTVHATVSVSLRAAQAVATGGYVIGDPTQLGEVEGLHQETCRQLTAMGVPGYAYQDLPGGYAIWRDHHGKIETTADGLLTCTEDAPHRACAEAERIKAQWKAQDWPNPYSVTERTIDTHHQSWIQEQAEKGAPGYAQLVVSSEEGEAFALLVDGPRNTTFANGERKSPHALPEGAWEEAADAAKAAHNEARIAHQNGFDPYASALPGLGTAPTPQAGAAVSWTR